MEIFYPNILKYGLMFCAVCLLLFGTGWLICTLLQEENDTPYERINRCYLYGFTTIIPVFALVITRGNSIMWIAVLLWVYKLLGYSKNKALKKSDHRKSKIEAVPIAVHVALALASFCFTYWMFFPHIGGNVWGDQCFYANSSVNLLRLHTETANLIGEVGVAKPYHYGDLWLAAFVIKLFGGNAVFVLTCVAYSTFLYLTVSATLCVVSKLLPKVNIIIALIISVSFIFFVPLLSIVIHWEGCICLSKCLVLVFLFWTAASAILKDDYDCAFFCVLMAAPMYSPVIPGVLCFVFLGSLILHSWKGMGMSVLICLFYLLFYYFQKNSPGSFGGETIFPNRTWMDMVLFVLKRSARFLVMIALVVIMYLLKWEKTKTGNVRKFLAVSIILAISVCVCTMMAGILRNSNIDGGQVATNFYHTAGWVFIYSTLLIIISDLCQDNGEWMIYLVALLLLFYPLHYFIKGDESFTKEIVEKDELEFYKTVKKELSGKSDLQYGYFRNYDIEENHNTQKSRACVILPTKRIPLVNEDGVYYPHCLSSLDYPDDILPMWDEHKSTLLFQYSKHHPERTKDECIMGFVHEQKIDYLIVEQGASLPRCLSKSSTEIASFEGNRFYKVLK